MAHKHDISDCKRLDTYGLLLLLTGFIGFGWITTGFSLFKENQIIRKEIGRLRETKDDTYGVAV